MRQFYLFLSCFLLTTLITYAQPANYAWIAQFDNGYTNTRTFTDGAAGSIIRSLTVQSTGGDNYLIEWDNFANKWQNTSSPLNQEFTLFHGDSNSPNGVISPGTISGKNYTFQIQGLAYTNRQAVIMETDNSPIAFGGTPVSPANPSVFPEQNLTLTVTLSGNKSTQEKAFVRYTDDSFATSQVVEVSFASPTASSGTATIPASYNTPGKSVIFYVYTTTVAATSTSNHDLFTLRLANNGGTNYSYTVANSWTTATGATTWSTASSWDAGEVPPAGAPVSINHDITLDQNATVSSLTLNSGTFTASDGSARELTISRSAAESATTITNSGGTWANGTGVSTVVFTGAPSSGDAIHGTSGTIAFQNVTINKTAGTDNVGVNFQTSSSVSGTLKIGNGGFVSTPPPTDFYDTSAILEFDQGVGAIYDVGATDNSWSTTEIPQNITVNSGTVNLNANRAATGNLIVASNATLNVSAGSNLEIDSNLTNSGSIELNSSSAQYSSLIVNTVTNTGTITYNRYTAQVAPTGTNDLIASPFSGQTFGAFATANGGVLAASGTLRAFAPFNNNSNAYDNYDTSSNNETVITSGQGYRAGTINGGTLAFEGTLNNSNLSVPLTVGSGSFWNLIGNPYSSYMDTAAFLTANSANLRPAYVAIYGYNGDNSNGQNSRWTILDFNSAPNPLITPSQGFFVAAPDGGSSAEFTLAMRTTGSSDDFITERNTTSDANFAHAILNLNTASTSYVTNVYFRDINTRGLDPGYDTGAFDQNAIGVFTQLVENNNGVNLVNQSLPYNDLNEVTVPLNVNMSQVQTLDFSLDSNTILPPAINVYLEDTVAGTFTLLNNNSYTVTPESALNGTGRFFLRFTSGTLSIGDEMANSLNMYQDTSAQVLVIEGQLQENTAAYIYDLQGRLVQSTWLKAGQLQHNLKVSSLQTGIYIVKIGQQITHKVMIR